MNLLLPLCLVLQSLFPVSAAPQSLLSVSPASYEDLFVLNHTFLELHFIVNMVQGENERQGGYKRLVFQSGSYLEASYNDCVELGLCAEGLTSTEQFINSTLDSDFSYFMSHPKINGNFSTKIRNNAFFPSDRNREIAYDPDDFEIYRPKQYHIQDFSKLLFLIPIYLFVASSCFGIYKHKSFFLGDYDFKFSNISRLLFKYLCLKMIYNMIYLVFLILHTIKDVTFENFHKLKLFFVLSNYSFKIFAFYLITLFAQGYYTSTFKFTPKMKKTSAVLIALYALQSSPQLKMEVQSLLISDSYEYTYYPQWILVILIILFFVLLGSMWFLTVNTYQNSKKDPRYIKSALVIFGSYAINPFIVIPSDQEFLLFLRNSFAVSDYVINDSFGIHIPEAIELVAIIMLIYIWRDLEYEDSTMLSELDLEN